MKKTQKIKKLYLSCGMYLNKSNKFYGKNNRNNAEP